MDGGSVRVFDLLVVQEASPQLKFAPSRLPIVTTERAGINHEQSGYDSRDSHKQYAHSHNKGSKSSAT